MKKYKIAAPEIAFEDALLPKEITDKCEIMRGEVGKRGDNSQLLPMLKDADAIIFTSSNNISAELMAKAPNLKAVIKAGPRHELVDYDYARTHGIAAGWTLNANDQSVAEHAVLLMLAAMKNFPEVTGIISRGGWRDEASKGQDLLGKTFGVIGFGAIAKIVCRIVKSFGTAHVLVYDPYLSAEAIAEFGYEKATLDEVLENSDVISLHCILTDETRGIINREALRKMKNSAILINVSRGAMVVEQDLIDALKAGEIRGAALDVFVEEPVAADHPLQKLHNAILTPHCAARTEESCYREFAWAIEGAFEYLEGKSPTKVKLLYPETQE